MGKKVSKRVKTLSGFMKWVEQFNDGQYLFRGVSKHTHKMEASAYRRLPEADRSNPNKLLKINQELINKARLLGHDQKDGSCLSDLELLAELQHFGAATCLIDFTRNAHIALWFACQQSSTGEANGKVFAVRADDPVHFKTITPKLVTGEEIDYFFKDDESGRAPLYQWQPKQQNNRVIAQQSVFIFGGSQVEIAAECVVLKSGKSEILDSLDSSAGITEASIYPDFDGFARLHAQNKPYIKPDVHSYLLRGFTAEMENNFDDAITYYGEVVSLQPDSLILAEALAARGAIYANKREYDLALSDLTKTVELSPKDARSYSNRGLAYLRKGDFAAAIEDFNKAIDLDPKNAVAYNGRGVAYVWQSDFEAAIENFGQAIDLDPENAGVNREYMRNRRFNRNIFGDLPTQRMAQKALPILVAHARKGEIITLRQLAQEIAPHLTQFNWSMGWALAWIHTTLYELERSDEWNYGEIPAIAAIAVDKPETPTNWMDQNTRIHPNTPLSWEDYETNHVLPVFEYPHWDKVMDFVYGRNEILADGDIPGPPTSGNSEDY
jgi:tetratricopeptide (TPR) repeat protein